MGEIIQKTIMETVSNDDDNIIIIIMAILISWLENSAATSDRLLNI